MTDWNGPMTKLQAINICLSSMGEPEVDAVEDGGLDALQADKLLDETAAMVQSKGWHWNREVHKLSPDITGNINLPNNTITADTTGLSAGVDVVQRGLRLFNRKDNTYIFTTPLEVEVYVILPWDELPFMARAFITYSAAMVLQQRILGADQTNKDLSARAKDAWNELVADEMGIGDYNMIRDNWSNASILYRGGFTRGGYR